MPVANTAHTPIFFFVGIFTCQTRLIGSRKRMKLEIALTEPATTKSAALSMQWPGSDGLHSLLVGTHCPIINTVKTVKKSRFPKMTPCMNHHVFFPFWTLKVFRYSRRRDNLVMNVIGA